MSGTRGRRQRGAPALGCVLSSCDVGGGHAPTPGAGRSELGAGLVEKVLHEGVFPGRRVPVSVVGVGVGGGEECERVKRMCIGCWRQAVTGACWAVSVDRLERLSYPNARLSRGQAEATPLLGSCTGGPGLGITGVDRTSTRMCWGVRSGWRRRRVALPGTCI